MIFIACQHVSRQSPPDDCWNTHPLPYADTPGCPEVDREQVPRREVRQDQEPASGGELAGSKSPHAVHVRLFSFVAPSVAVAASLRVLRLMGVVLRVVAVVARVKIPLSKKSKKTGICAACLNRQAYLTCTRQRNERDWRK